MPVTTVRIASLARYKDSSLSVKLVRGNAGRVRECAQDFSSLYWLQLCFSPEHFSVRRVTHPLGG